MARPNTLAERLPTRRQILTDLAVGFGAGLATMLPARVRADASAPERVHDFLKKRLLSREDVAAWLAGKEFPFGKYDAELGYLHRDRDFREGQNGAICCYRYDRLDARRMFAHAGQPCRINTYGDSFTSCEQVSDGETWQEVLAAHLGEPVRNYGIGGYSVYQAYLRMVREERRAPAPYIILNIFDDDHCRNLHGWQRIRFGVNRKSTNPTIPHLRVDADKNEFREIPNPCPTPESIYQLSDLEKVMRLFGDDYYLQMILKRADLREAGRPAPASDFDDVELTRHALYASRRVVEKVEAFAAAQKRRVLYVLSYNPQTIRRRLEGKPRFDAPFVAYFDERKLPYVDLLEAHAADYAEFRSGVDAYLKRYFIGHYNPLGNFFCAFAMKDKLVKMLDPKPPAYGM